MATERPSAAPAGSPAVVRPRWWDVDVTTDLVPRTDVERWQMQDRIRAALALAEPAARLSGFFLRGPRIAFRIRPGRGRRAHLLRALAAAPWR